MTGSTFHLIDTCLALTVVVINFAFAVLILARTPRGLISAILLLICCANIVWNLGDFLFFTTAKAPWFYFSLIGSSMLPALMFHWVNALVVPGGRTINWTVAAYCFSGFLAGISPIALLHPQIERFVVSLYWNILFLFLLGPFLIAGFVMLIRAIRLSQSAEERGRLNYILIVMAIGVTTGLTDLFPALGVPIPPLGHLGCAVYSSVMIIGVWKYREPYDLLTQMEMKLEKQSAMAQEVLRKSEEKYRTILHSIEEGYYEVDLEGNLTFFNESLCRILGYSREELAGMNNRRYMSEETARTVYETFNAVYRTGIPAQAFDWELMRKDGAKRVLETSVSLLRDPDGNVVGFYGVGRDITERKRAEEQARLHQQQLMQASKMVALGTLVSGVAHEVNNPNNFIMLNAPLLKDVWKDARPVLDEYYETNGDFLIGGVRYSEMRENVSSLFSGVMDGAKRIKQIVEDLKDFVRRDPSDMRQTVDINAVLRSTVSLLSNMIMKSTSHFSVSYGQELPLLQGNFQRLEQVLMNLIQNACQALPDKEKKISVGTFCDPGNGCVVVKIVDEGIGIPDELLPRIMDPFFTTKRDCGGIGLGLSICSGIVKDHGGTLHFNSEPGRGTVASVILPMVRADDARTEREDA
jgi:PAS domain S-box-containing protein